jgi:hypothetical protein
MTRGVLRSVAVPLLLLATSCEQQVDSVSPSRAETPTPEQLVGLAHCLTGQGFVMYGSITCSACRAQRKAFGPAFAHITEVECNPHATNTQAERCLQRKIQTTPTWIAEHDGQERKRLEGYQLLEDLAAFAGCPL